MSFNTLSSDRIGDAKSIQFIDNTTIRKQPHNILIKLFEIQIEGCEDINECSLGVDNCAEVEDGGKCTNVPGGFKCSCRDGYAGDGLTCADVDECALGACDANAACINSIGSFSCSCNDGFDGNGLTCTDIDECHLMIDNCHHKASCTNVPGTFREI